MDDCKDRDILVVTTTVPTLAQGQALGRALLEARLAACVQLESLQSLYRWQGRVCDDPEVRLTIKTLPTKSQELQAFLARNHPYDVPQFVAQRMQGSAAYCSWVASCAQRTPALGCCASPAYACRQQRQFTTARPAQTPAR